MEISFGLRKILAFCLVIALLSGCKKTDKQQTFNGKTVNFAMEKLAEQQNMLNRVDSISFIPLNAVCEDALLKQINKCSVVDDKIYLLDYFGNASLTVWDNTGTFLYKIGQRG